MTAILNSIIQITVLHNLYLCSGDLSFPFRVTMLPQLFMVLEACSFDSTFEVMNTFLIQVLLILTIGQDDNWRSFFCLPADGAIVQVFVFYHLCYLPSRVMVADITVVVGVSFWVTRVAGVPAWVSGHHHCSREMWHVEEGQLCKLIVPLSGFLWLLVAMRCSLEAEDTSLLLLLGSATCGGRSWILGQ